MIVLWRITYLPLAKILQTIRYVSL